MSEAFLKFAALVQGGAGDGASNGTNPNTNGTKQTAPSSSNHTNTESSVNEEEKNQKRSSTEKGEAMDFDTFMSKYNRSTTTGKKVNPGKYKFKNSKAKPVAAPSGGAITPLSSTDAVLETGGGSAGRVVVGKNRLSKGPDGTIGFLPGRGRPV